MSWEARLDGRNSLVLEDGVGILGATGPMSRSDEEHEKNVLKAAAAEDLLAVAKAIRESRPEYDTIEETEQLKNRLAQAIAKAEGKE